MELKNMKRKNLLKIGQIILVAMLVLVSSLPVTLGSLAVDKSNEALKSSDMNILGSNKLKITVDESASDESHNSRLYFNKIIRELSFDRIRITFTVTNTGDEPVNWSSEIVDFWSIEIEKCGSRDCAYERFLSHNDLLWHPSSGTKLGPGESEQVTMTFDYIRYSYEGEYEMQKYCFGLKVYDEDLKDFNYDRAGVVVQTDGFDRSRSLSHSDNFLDLFNLLQFRFPFVSTLLQRLSFL
jgi:hypothetical protein